MKKMTMTFLLAVTLFSIGYAQEKLQWTPFLQQAGMYYSSDNVTSDGFGLGLGIHVLHITGVAGQADVNILWGNGNAITTRLAAGYERKGKWTPGIYATFNLIWGQQVQILTENGEKPPVPALAAGIRITPLKFQTKLGYISALELGYGFGPAKAMSLEFNILSIGISF